MPVKSLFSIAAVLCCLSTAGAAAQSPLSDEARLNLAATFIGKSLLMEQVSKRCSVQFSEPSYGGESAMAKLFAFLHENEQQIFREYLKSDVYVDNVRHTETAFREAFDATIAKGTPHVEACELFAESFLAQYEQTKADLERLR